MNKLIITLLFTSGVAGAQPFNPHTLVGSPCPDFRFNEVRFFRKEQVSPKDFRGQWLILDFWNKHCGTCIGKMPATDSLQRKFTGKVQVLLVGYTGSLYTHRPDNSIREFYSGIRTRMHIDLPIAYDSVMFDRLAIGPCPYIVVIDPKGVVRAVTTEIKAKAMTEFLAGRQPVLEKAENRKGR